MTSESNKYFIFYWQETKATNNRVTRNKIVFKKKHFKGYITINDDSFNYSEVTIFLKKRSKKNGITCTFYDISNFNSLVNKMDKELLN